MSPWRLILRNLLYHRRGNLAVALGVAVGTAVLTGALLVGDSLRGSLRGLTMRRLGWVDEAMVTPRFFRQALADDLTKAGAAERVAPALLLQGSAQPAADDGADPLDRAAAVVRRVTVLGVDERFWADGVPEGWKANEKQVYLNATLQRELKVEVGAEVVLSVQQKSEVPRESLLGRRDESVQELTLKVAGVLPDERPLATFSLSPSAEPARNAFVPLSVLQEALELRQAGQGRVNALLVGGIRKDLDSELKAHLRLADWSLKLRTPSSRVEALQEQFPERFTNGKLDRRGLRELPETFVKELKPAGDGVSKEELKELFARRSPYVSLESDAMFLSPRLALAWEAAARRSGLKAAPTLVYLANSITAGDNSIPYSIVAALDPTLPPPLGPFLPPGKTTLADDEIVLVEWKDSPLQGKPGDSVLLTYFAPDVAGQAQEKTASFRLAGVIPLEGVAADPNLTPPFPGVTDKLSLGEWDPPFPYDNRRIKPNDDRFWREHRTTPKAYITLNRGQKLWQSRFGDVTSVRLRRPGDDDLDRQARDFEKELLSELKPADGGFVFNKVKAEGLAASKGSLGGGNFDFGDLFLAFSIFLIVAALLLVGLLFRLNLDRRASEIGLLLACGYPPGRTRRLYLVEGSILAQVGGLIGLGLGVGYAALLLEYLRAKWPAGSGLPFLSLHVTVESLLIGFLLGYVVSLATVWWAVHGLRKLPPRGLLQGQATTASNLQGRRPWLSTGLAVVCVLAGLALLGVGTILPGQEARAGSFFGGGALLLSAGLCGLWAWLRRPRHSRPPGHGLTALARLGIRNATRHPIRSLLTAGLLASATFLVVAVECFRRKPDANYLDKHSGSGGFPLVAESELPLFLDFEDASDRERILNRFDELYQTVPPEKRPPRQTAQDLLQSIRVYSFRVRSGDDASCLNLYQPRQPRVVGVPPSLRQRGGFSFTATTAQTPEQRDNPWLLLGVRQEESVPVFGENNTVVWMLGSGLGRQVESSHAGRSTPFRIAGLLHDSVFQSSLLMAEERFLELYPQEQGHRLFLIETPPGQEAEVERLLEGLFAAEGLEVTPTAKRLEAFLAVENMYLTTFQALGGLGLLLGSLGLAVVLLRGVWERRAELALLRALGYRRMALGWLVLAENAFLLAVGLALGALAALLAVAPQVIGRQASVPWLELAGLLSLVLVVGLAAAAAAVASTVRAALVPALRRE